MRADQHQPGADEIADENARPRARLDQAAEEKGAPTPPIAVPAAKKNAIGERADLDRKSFAHGQIGGARRRRGEEKDRHPGDVCSVAVIRSWANSQPLPARSRPEAA